MKAKPILSLKTDYGEFQLVECSTLGTYWCDIMYQGKMIVAQVLREDASQWLKSLEAKDSAAEEAFIKISNVHGWPAYGCAVFIPKSQPNGK